MCIQALLIRQRMTTAEMHRTKILSRNNVLKPEIFIQAVPFMLSLVEWNRVFEKPNKLSLNLSKSMFIDSSWILHQSMLVSQ